MSAGGKAAIPDFTAAGVGVVVIFNTWADISGSEIRNSGFAGIDVFGSSAVGVTGSTIENNDRIGIAVTKSSFGNIRDNVIDGNGDGIFVTENSSIFLSNNTITNNTGHGLSVSRHGSVETLLPASTFAGNLGVDVRCIQRGILNFNNGPQLPSTGTTAIDETSLFACIVEGSIFWVTAGQLEGKGQGVEWRSAPFYAWSLPSPPPPHELPGVVLRVDLSASGATARLSL